MNGRLGEGPADNRALPHIRRPPTCDADAARAALPATPARRRPYSDAQTVPTPPKPSAPAVFSFRSQSRPPTYGPRSSTVAVTLRPPLTKVTLVPQGRS